MKRYRLRIEGKVQGVWFRKYTRDEALRLGLAGWVANEPDGSVYVEAEGPEETLNVFVAWCHGGSPLSRVERVTWTEHPMQGEEGFDIRR
jgi:acylphosphatase